MSPTFSVVIPAAGSGSRVGGAIPKQFREIGGKAVIAHTIERFLQFDEVDCVVVPAAEGQHITMLDLVENSGWEKVRVVLGGASRQESVLKGLEFLRPNAPRFVAVHDAVRPFLSSDLIRRVLDAAYQYNAALPVLRLTDTIHRVDDSSFVAETPDRREFALAQTPQCFAFELLFDAMTRSVADGFVGTDEAGVVAHYGYRVFAVEGELENFKITHLDDFQRAEQRVRSNR